MQTKEWNPILDWFNKRFETDLKPSIGICAVDISEGAKENLRRYFTSYDTWAISGQLNFFIFRS